MLNEFFSRKKRRQIIQNHCWDNGMSLIFVLSIGTSNIYLTISPHLNLAYKLCKIGVPWKVYCRL